MRSLILPRRKLLLGAAAALITSPAIIRGVLAQVPMTGAGLPKPTAAAAAAWYPNATAQKTNGVFSGTVTFPATMTSAATDTVIVLLAVAYGAVSGVTVGGDTMTSAVYTGGATGDAKVGIYYKVGAYTDPNIVVSSGFGDICCAYGKWTGASAVPDATTQTLAPFAWGSPPFALPSLTVPSGGSLLAVLGMTNAGPWTWNITKDTEVHDSGAGWGITTASYNVSGAKAADADNGSYGGRIMAGITIGP